MRRALLGIVAALLAWSGLGAAGLLPPPWDLLERGHRPLAPPEELAGDAVPSEGHGATLTGRGGGRPEPRGESTATAPVPGSEVRGSVERGAVVRGRVLRGAGATEPVLGARVTLNRPNPVTSYLKASPEGRWDVLEARTDRQGRFAFLDVRPAKGYVVRAFAPGQGAASAPRQDLRDRQVLDVGDLVLPVTGGWTGRVVDGDGVGLPDVRVAVTWQVESMLGLVLADPDLLPEVEAEGRTAADGTFRIEGLEPGPKTIVVASRSHGGKVLTGPKVVAGAAAPLPDIALAGAGVVAGRVEWDDGKPAPGARVFAGEPKPGKPTLRATLCAADGTFRLDHLEGEEVRLGVFVPGIPVDPSEDVRVGTLDTVIRLPAAGSVAGRVARKADGAPVARFGIRLEPAGGESWMARAVRTLIDNALGAQGFVAADGRFRLPVVAHGTWRVVVSAQGYPEARSEPFAVAAGVEADAGTVALTDGNGLAGVALDAASGEPVAGVEVRLFRARASSGEGLDDENFGGSPAPPDAVTDAAGRFEVAPQTPGTYALGLVHPFHEHHLVETVDLSRGPVTDLEVRLLPAGRMRARVLEADGRPAESENVALVCAGGWGNWEATDAEGEIEWTGVPAGPCLVRWMGRGEAGAVQAVFEAGDPRARGLAYDALRRSGHEEQVVAGQERVVTIRLPGRPEVTVRLPEPRVEGEVVWHVLLHAPGTQTWKWLERDGSGAYRSRLEPGTYRVWLYWRASDGSITPGDGREVSIPDVPTHVLDLR